MLKLVVAVGVTLRTAPVKVPLSQVKVMGAAPDPHAAEIATGVPDASGNVADDCGLAATLQAAGVDDVSDNV